MKKKWAAQKEREKWRQEELHQKIQEGRKEQDNKAVEDRMTAMWKEQEKEWKAKSEWWKFMKAWKEAMH